MLDYAEPVTKLIDEFKRLPGIGHKTAQRLAFHILRVPEADVERFVEALREVVDVPVELFDERFTTDLAEAGGRAAEDARAAAHLLESYLAWSSRRS